MGNRNHGMCLVSYDSPKHMNHLSLLVLSLGGADTVAQARVVNEHAAPAGTRHSLLHVNLKIHQS